MCFKLQTKLLENTIKATFKNRLLVCRWSDLSCPMQIKGFLVIPFIQGRNLEGALTPNRMLLRTKNKQVSDF